MAKKEITLATLSAQMVKAFATQGKEIQDLTETLRFVVKQMATKDDIADLRREFKGDIVAVAQQVNSIETQLRDMRHTKLQSRVADLEEEVFGKTRA
jgi:phosphoenolpyruvate-protein kinase (PTS system EI component)